MQQVLTYKADPSSVICGFNSKSVVWLTAPVIIMPHACRRCNTEIQGRLLRTLGDAMPCNTDTC